MTPAAAGLADSSQTPSPAGAAAPLPPLSTVGRLERLRARLSDAGVGAAVFADACNVRWLTGFTGSSGTVVVTAAAESTPAGASKAAAESAGGAAGAAMLVTDARYAEQAPAELAAAGCLDGIEVVIAGSAVAAAADRLGGVLRLGLETTVSWGEQRRWHEAVDADLVPLTDAVEELRAVKDAAELARMSAAALIADRALDEVRPRLRPGETELGIQRALDDAMRRLGATGPAYETIVASGPNSALPHARPTRRRLAAGDLLVIDVGAEVDGYRSDMTRTFALGAPAPRAAAMIDVATRSQAAGVAAVRPGVEAAEIDRVCRSVIAEAGMGDAFVHGTGHGVGLRIHELPRLGRGSTAILRPGNVVTVEPGVYVPGVGGVRVEDLVAVTEHGCRPLTRHPKDPPVIL